jgi:hypothetical protein
MLCVFLTWLNLIQIQFDKLKRKTLFAPTMGNENSGIPMNVPQNPFLEDQRSKARIPLGNPPAPSSKDINSVIGGMEASRVSSELILHLFTEATFLFGNPILDPENAPRYPYEWWSFLEQSTGGK